MNALGWATLGAALIAALIAPWAKDRIDRRSRKHRENEADRRTITTLVDNQVDRLFKETDRLRAAYRADIDDLRAQLRESNDRVSLLEHEVAEWRAGIRGVEGVWVAIPAHVWEFVRERLPDLPTTRFPGERPSQASETSSARGDLGGRA